MSARKKATATPEAGPAITSIKGFDRDLRCRGYQYALGQTYEHAGKAAACIQGFHACTVDAHPFEVFGYYPPSASRFCVVTQAGQTHTDDKIKIASTRITIDVELSIGDIVKRAWEFVWSRATKSDAAHVDGEREAASSTGEQGAASSTGYQGAASSTGYRGAASSTGYRGAASSTGEQGAASSTGYRGAASSTGEQGAAMASGYNGRVMGADGNALFAIERDDSYRILSVVAGIVGQDGIAAGVWYVCRTGKLVEVAA